MARLKSVEELNAYRELIKKSKISNKTCITICHSTGCKAFGAEGVGMAFERVIKEQGLEDKVEVLKTGCHGFCERGPLVIILPQEIFYQKVAIEDVNEIISSALKNEIIDRLLYEDPVTGKKVLHEHEVPFYAKQKRIIFADNGRIDPTCINHYIERGGYSALSKILTSMSPEQVIQEIKDSGLRGRGGAGFPTGLKWEFCRKAEGTPKYIICNADEGDPGAFMDRSLLEGNPHLVLEGILIAAYAIGASEGYVYVRAEYPLAVKHIRIAIEEAQELGLLGDNILGTDFSFHLKVKEGAGAFVSGEETALIASIEGRRSMPRPRPPFPVHSGLWGKPTNINNVETFANIPYIVLKGSKEFAKIGTEKSKGTKIFALAGKVNNTGLVEVAMGTTLREIIFDIGGGIQKGRKFKAVQLGGPSGGCLPTKYLDLPIDYDTLVSAGTMMGSGGMIVMDENNCMVEIARFFLEFIHNESCGQCTPCRIGTKRMLEILTRITEGNGKEEDIDTLIKLSNLIKDASLCGLGKTAPNPILSTIEHFRDEYEEHIRKKKCRAQVCSGLYTAPCTDTCPVGVEVHSYVVLIAEQRFADALNLIKQKNPFPSICGRVCHRPCEVRCRRAEIDKPVALRALKRFVADLEIRLESGRPKLQVQFHRAERVAIIGAGPAGLACSYYLARKGYRVTIFEALETPGGMLMVGIPNYRLPKKILKWEINNILDLGVEIKTNIEVGKDIEFDDILKEYNAVFISTGAGISKQIGIEGEEAKGVISALDFLRNVNLGNPIEIGKKVAVIGGSNGAIDSARTAIRFGSDVTLLYNRSKADIMADYEEIEAAEEEGVKIEPFTIPKRILSENGRVKGIECIKMQVKESLSFDKTGKRIIEPIKDSKFVLEFVLEVDTVIVAVGRDVACSFLKDRIELTDAGTIKVDDQTMATNLPGVFAGGDVVTGAATVIEAIDAGNRAAVAIDKYLNDGQISKDVVIESRIPLFIEEKKIPIKVKKERHIMPVLTKEERIKGFEEVELGFTYEMAVAEAKRCIRCYKKE